jgi:translation initiation factor 1 (eIF-1/SUI1)
MPQSQTQQGVDSEQVAAICSSTRWQEQQQCTCQAIHLPLPLLLLTPQVVLESHTRNKKKCVTTVTGLEGFGVKLSEAAKLFGKKFACGASVVKNATGTEQIDMQVGGK